MPVRRGVSASSRIRSENSSANEIVRDTNATSLQARSHIHSCSRTLSQFQECNAYPKVPFSEYQCSWYRTSRVLLPPSRLISVIVHRPTLINAALAPGVASTGANFILAAIFAAIQHSSMQIFIVCDRLLALLTSMVCDSLFLCEV